MNIIQFKKLFLKHSFKLILIGLVVLLIFVICKNGFREHWDATWGKDYIKYEIDFLDIGEGKHKTLTVIWPNNNQPSWFPYFVKLNAFRIAQQDGWWKCTRGGKYTLNTQKAFWKTYGSGKGIKSATDLYKLLEIDTVIYGGVANLPRYAARKFNLRWRTQAGNTLWDLFSGPQGGASWHTRANWTPLINTLQAAATESSAERTEGKDHHARGRGQAERQYAKNLKSWLMDKRNWHHDENSALIIKMAGDQSVKEGRGCKALWDNPLPKWPSGPGSYMNDINAGIFLLGMASVYVTDKCNVHKIKKSINDNRSNPDPMPKNYANILHDDWPLISAAYPKYNAAGNRQTGTSIEHKVFLQDDIKIIIIHSHDSSYNGKLHVYKYDKLERLKTLISGTVQTNFRLSVILNIFLDMSKNKIYFIGGQYFTIRQLTWMDTTTLPIVLQAPWLNPRGDFVSISPTDAATCPGIYGITLEKGGKLSCFACATKGQSLIKKNDIFIGLDIQTHTFDKILHFHVHKVAHTKNKKFFIIAKKPSNQYFKIEITLHDTHYKCGGTPCNPIVTQSKPSRLAVTKKLTKSESVKLRNVSNKRILDIHVDGDTIKYLFAQ